MMRYPRADGECHPRGDCAEALREGRHGGREQGQDVRVEETGHGPERC